jgi:hypothetical protein
MNNSFPRVYIKGDCCSIVHYEDCPVFVSIKDKPNIIKHFSKPCYHRCTYYKNNTCESYDHYYMNEDELEITKDRNLALLNIRNESDFKSQLAKCVVMGNVYYE